MGSVETTPHMAETTKHFDRVAAFMERAGQTAPLLPTIPTEETARLRARLILEEALETINALGVRVTVKDTDTVLTDPRAHFTATLECAPVDTPNLIGIADGCADLSVVTIGTLVACGIPDDKLLRLVDLNNLDKFGPGHRIDEYGKLIKPPTHTPPDISGLLVELADQAVPLGCGGDAY